MTILPYTFKVYWANAFSLNYSKEKCFPLGHSCTLFDYLTARLKFWLTCYNFKKCINCQSKCKFSYVISYGCRGIVQTYRQHLACLPCEVATPSAVLLRCPSMCLCASDVCKAVCTHLYDTYVKLRSTASVLRPCVTVTGSDSIFMSGSVPLLSFFFSFLDYICFCGLL